MHLSGGLHGPTGPARSRSAAILVSLRPSLTSVLLELGSERSQADEVEPVHHITAAPGVGRRTFERHLDALLELPCSQKMRAWGRRRQLRPSVPPCHQPAAASTEHSGIHGVSQAAQLTGLLILLS